MRLEGAVASTGLCVLLCTAASPAAAEWDLALYGGASHTPRSDVTMVIGSQTGPADHTFHDVKWDRSGEAGLRAGYWFVAVPWYGVGLDVFRFNADVPTQTVDVTIQGSTAPVTLQQIDFTVTALAFDVVRLRYPLFASEQYPRGKLQPYVTAGPALFRVEVTNVGNGELTKRTATDTVWGYKLGAGLAWALTRSVTLFGEYRYTHFHAEPELQGTITGAMVPTHFDLNTHHLVGGVSVSF